MFVHDAHDAGKGAIRVMQINSTTIDITGHNPSLQIYNCTVDVLRPVKVVISTGVAESYTTLVSNWACAIRWKTGRERIMFDKTSYFMDAELTCRVPGGVTIKTTDRVVYNSDVFEIVGLTDIQNLGRRLRISIKRIE